MGIVVKARQCRLGNVDSAISQDSEQTEQHACRVHTSPNQLALLCFPVRLT